MTGAVFLALCTQIGLGLLLVALLLALVRLVLGPGIGDRILVLDLITTLAASMIATIAVATGITLYIDIAIALALVGFLSTISLARYLAVRARTKMSPEDHK